MRFGGLLFCLLLFNVAAAEGQPLRDTRSIALSGSECADSRSVLEVNPAFTTDSGLTIWTRLTPNAAYVDGAFEASGAAVYRVNALHFGLGLDHLGFGDLYRYDDLSIGGSASISVSGDELALVGARLSFDRLSFGSNYPTRSGTHLDLGARTEPFSDFLLAVTVTDLTANIEEDRLGILGVGYRIERSTLLASAVLRHDQLTFRFGAEVSLSPTLALRAGTNTETGALTGGVAVAIHEMMLELSFERHPELGAALSFGLQWSAK
jgi:hypothetical protein